MDIAERCGIHADKMQEEGWYVTANVLAEAQEAILKLRHDIEALENELSWTQIELDYAITC